MAAQMALEHQGERESQWKVIASIAAKFACSGETPRIGVRREVGNRGLRPGRSTRKQDRTRSLRGKCAGIDGPTPHIVGWRVSR